ncbi:hypothetical protein H4R24_004104 [Coemansia sp. RSA 988]|nr:hypothetical protein H4R24_004104 [Coemansia sp. RSA 988]
MLAFTTIDATEEDAAGAAASRKGLRGTEIRQDDSESRTRGPVPKDDNTMELRTTR